MKIIQNFLGHHFAIIFVAAIFMILASGQALAFDSSNTAIPATACVPADGSDSKVRMVNGAWAFKSGQTGIATLYCPLPLRSSFDSIKIGDIRIFFKDTDAAGHQSNVTVRLVFRKDNGGGIWFSGPAWDSNNSTGTIVHDITSYHTINRTLSYHAIYSFRVQLQRININEDPVFSGIDFDHRPVG